MKTFVRFEDAGGETPDAVSIDARLATLRLDERRRIRINS